MTENSTILDHVLLESCRPLLILGAFFTQRPSLMSKPEWKVMQPRGSDEKTHFSQASSAASYMSYLIEILAKLPALFLQCNECIGYSKTEPSSHTYVSTLWNTAKQLQEELQNWKEKWDNDHRNEIYLVLPSTAVNSNHIMAWNTILQYSSVELAITVTMYHTVIILVTSIPQSLLKIASFPSSSTFTISDNPIIIHPLPNIPNSIHIICRTIEYFLHLLQPSQAPADYYLFFPMHVARRASVQMGFSLELAWLTDAFEMMRLRFPMDVWASMDFKDQFSGLEEGLFG